MSPEPTQLAHRRSRLDFLLLGGILLSAGFVILREWCSQMPPERRQ